MTVRFYFILLALMCSASPAVAAPGYTNPSLVSNTSVRETAVEVNIPNGGNPMGCSTSSLFRIPSTASNYQAIVAAILSSTARGKRINVYAYACDTDGLSLFVAVQVIE